MEGVAGEDEGDAMDAFVVYYFRHLLIYVLLGLGLGYLKESCMIRRGGSSGSGELHETEFLPKVTIPAEASMVRC